MKNKLNYYSENKTLAHLERPPQSGWASQSEIDSVTQSTVEKHDKANKLQNTQA